MLCCKPKKESYDLQLEEEGDAPSESRTGKKAEKVKKKGGKSKGKETPVDEVKNGSVEPDKIEHEKRNDVKSITPQIEETLVRESENKTESNYPGNENQSNAHTDVNGSEINNEFSSHENLYIERVPKDTESTISHRDAIEMARHKFFVGESASSGTDKFEEKIKKITQKSEPQLQEKTDNEADDDQVMSYEQMQDAVNRLEQVAARLESLSLKTDAGGSKASSGGGPSGEESAFVKAYDDITSGLFAKYLTLSNTIGGDVQTQAAMVKKAFQGLRDFLLIVATSKKPAQNVFMSLLTPISNQIASIQEFRENNRSSPLFNHLSGIAESIPALGWITVEPTPGPFVKEMSDAGMFYTNRVVKDFREKDENHVAWTKAWLGTLREMQAYIKAHHTTGISWNAQGGDVSVAAAPAPAGGAPPPPPAPGPPPPPPPGPEPGDVDAAGDQDTRTALFADLNKGEGVTSGLKKVTNDMKTHKNPALKSGVRAGPAPFKAAAPPKPAPKPTNKAVAEAKPPILELQNKKWVVEHQIGNKTMVIDDTNLKQTVYMYKCQDSTIQIKGKINSITVDSCKKVAVVFEDVVSAIEFVNSQRVQAQVSGKCPTISIDKTDGVLMYLSKDSLNAEIVTAKSSEMNILVPTDDGDFTEFPLPEQYKTVWNGKKFTTTSTDSI